MRRLTLAVALTCALPAAGCRLIWPPPEPAPPRPPPTIVMVGHEFDDILVPRGFVQIAEKSRIVQGVGFRSGSLVYRGALRQTILRDWYKQNMPAKGWTQLPPPAGESGAGPYTLRFEKGEEHCELLIEAPGAETFVTLSLGLK